MSVNVSLQVENIRSILSTFIESSDSDESGEDSLNVYVDMFDVNPESSEDESEPHAAVSNFIETISKYSDADFKAHFRVNRETAHHLIDRYSASDFIPVNEGGRRRRIGSDKEIYIFLWYVANSVTFRQIANLFAVAKSSAWNSVRRVSYWLISIGHEHIKWPQGTKAIQVASKFENRRNIPAIIGAIDCTHIKIKAPKEDKISYFDRKRQYSIVVQAVVDADKKFTDVYIGEPGSLHDYRVLKRSDLYRRAIQNPTETFPGETFIIGDSAYPSSSWLVSPFKDFGTLSDTQISFNFLHSSTRMVVENTFGLLKTRFRRLLHFTEQSNLSVVSDLVLSICILHNICIQFNDEIDQEDSTFNDSGESETVTQDVSSDRRQKLVELLQSKQIIR